MCKFFLSQILLIFIFAFSLNAEQLQVKVSGMSCESCVEELIQKFQTLESIEKASGDFDSKMFTLVLRNAQNLTDEQLIELVKSAGYKVTSIERTKTPAL